VDETNGGVGAVYHGPVPAGFAEALGQDVGGSCGVGQIRGARHHAERGGPPRAPSPMSGGLLSLEVDDGNDGGASGSDVGVLEVVKKRPGVVGSYVTCRRWGFFLLAELIE
jgi:hypothetical protein